MAAAKAWSVRERAYWARVERERQEAERVGGRRRIY